MTLLPGLVLAGLSALVTQVGFLLRHRGAVEAPDVDVRRPLRSVAGLFRSRWWTIGYAARDRRVRVPRGRADTRRAVACPGGARRGPRGAGGDRRALLRVRAHASPVGGRAAHRRRPRAARDHGRRGAPGRTAPTTRVAAMLIFEGALTALGVALILSCRSDSRSEHTGIVLGAAAGPPVHVHPRRRQGAHGQDRHDRRRGVPEPVPLGGDRWAASRRSSRRRARSSSGPPCR